MQTYPCTAFILTGYSLCMEGLKLMKQRKWIVILLCFATLLFITTMFVSCSNECSGCTYGSWKITPATCTTEGIQQRVCINCGRTTSLTIPATGHTPSEWITESTNPCIEGGLCYQKCTVCAELLNQKVVEAGHRLDEWTAVKEATCTEDGLHIRTCSVCQETIEQKVLPVAHMVVTIPARNATCENNGLTAGESCSVCRQTLKEQQVIRATGHDWVQDSAVAPTCSQTGLTEGIHCNNCKAIQVEQQIIPKKDHTIVKDSVVAATCTTAGKSEGNHCKVCQTVITEQISFSPLGHSFSKKTNTCSHCLAKEYNEISSRAELEEYDGCVNTVVYLNKCLTVSNTNEYVTLTIEPCVDYIRFVGTPGVTYNVCVKVKGERQDKLRIDVVDATLKSIVNSPVINIECKQTVDLGFYGDTCKLIAKNGSNGANGSISKVSMHGDAGKPGNNAISSQGNLRNH